MADEKNTKKKDWIRRLIIFGIAIVIGVVLALPGKESAPENYNDNSISHQILAKNYFKDYLKDNMKDAKSYEEVDYTSFYNDIKGCYEVTLKYRGTNSFGAKVLEQASGDVYFDGTKVSIRNVRTE